MSGYEYQPIIFGTLCDGECAVDKRLARMLKGSVGDSVLLPFSVERRHLKNVVATMRLMDIAGLVVEGGHKKAIMKHLPSRQHSARESGSADVVARIDGTFKGFDSVALALEGWLEEIGVRRGRALFAGSDPLFDRLNHSFKKLGFGVARYDRAKANARADIIIIGKLPSRNERGLTNLIKSMEIRPAVIDLRNRPKSIIRSPRLTKPQLEKRALNTRVELLTAAVNNNLS